MIKQAIIEQAIHGIMEVEFTKTDGSVRKMRFTLHPKVLPVDDRGDQHVIEQTRKENPNVLSVWDMDLNEWRSFRIDSIVRINYIQDINDAILSAS